MLMDSKKQLVLIVYKIFSIENSSSRISKVICLQIKLSNFLKMFKSNFCAISTIANSILLGDIKCLSISINRLPIFFGMRKIYSFSNRKLNQYLISALE